jgi:hypothetical protein
MADPTGFPPVPLLANSYDLQSLEKATLAAEAISDDTKRAEAFGKLATDHALNQDVLNGLNSPAVPEGTKLETVEDALGREVEVPVAIVDEESAAQDTGSTGRRRKPPTDTTTGTDS